MWFKRPEWFEKIPLHVWMGQGMFHGLIVWGIGNWRSWTWEKKFVNQWQKGKIGIELTPEWQVLLSPPEFLNHHPPCLQNHLSPSSGPWKPEVETKMLTLTWLSMMPSKNIEPQNKWRRSMCKRSMHRKNNKKKSMKSLSCSSYWGQALTGGHWMLQAKPSCRYIASVLSTTWGWWYVKSDWTRKWPR